jgi:hypothetical protein
VARFADRLVRARLVRGAAVLALAIAAGACGEQGRFGGVGGGGTTGPGGGTGTGSGAGAPTVQILQPSVAGLPVAVGDSVFVQTRVTDDRGVVRVEFFGIAPRGDVNLGTDQQVTRFASKTVNLPPGKTDTTLTRYLLAVPGDQTSEFVNIIVVATDSAGNTGTATATVRVTNGPRVRLDAPTGGSFASVGRDITIQVTAVDPQGVRIVGWRTAGVLVRADSIILPAGALPDSVTFVDTLTVPSGTPLGNLTIAAFAVDSVGDPSGTAQVGIVVIQSSVNDNTPPLVRFTVQPRVEVDDSITVTATDASGIVALGFVVRQVGNNTVVAQGSVTGLSGQQTTVSRTFTLALDTISAFPRLVSVEAFATDANGNQGLSASGTTPVPATGVAKLDTLTVVAGRTFPLPSGGQLADAVYNRNRNEIYFSNFGRDRIEVFNVATGTFLAGGIPVGSRPWGLAMWPRNTTGAYGDTLIVANSGGTNLSIVDMVSRTEVRRHRLPNYLIQTVSTTLSPTGALTLDIVEYDVSDRPQFVAAGCRNNCANVFALYSTTPTAAQPSPFTNRGYVAWEELTAPPGTPNGHFFWEHGTSTANTSNDTLQIIAVRDVIPGVQVRDTVLGAGAGIMVSLNTLAFQDSTYVRTSGNFNLGIIGEGGGEIDFARALTWDASAGMVTLTGTGCNLLGLPLACNAAVDQGISAGIFVRDFVNNRAARIQAVATNFNGLTNFVRADSIYVFDVTLRQTGMLQVSGDNAGMDVHPNHQFDARSRGTGGLGGTGDPNDRLLFAARADANIEVLDTYFFGSVTLLPVRDPIVGQLRMAQSPTGQVLVGVTAQGIVVVPLTTAITNPFPVRQTSPLRARRSP